MPKLGGVRAVQRIPASSPAAARSRARRAGVAARCACSQGFHHRGAAVSEVRRRGPGQLQPVSGLPRRGPQRRPSTSLSVRIPAGIDDGMQLRSRGEGNERAERRAHRRSPTCWCASASTRCSPATAPTSTATCRCPSRSWRSGAEIEVPVLGGTAKLKVPGGSQPGQLLRLRGRGMPRLRERGHGDACYRLRARGAAPSSTPSSARRWRRSRRRPRSAGRSAPRSSSA